MKTAEQRIRDASQAQYILTHPLVTDAFRDMETVLNDALTSISERDLEGMKHLVLMKKCLKKFKRVFESHIESGKIAEKELTERERRGLRRIF